MAPRIVRLELTVYEHQVPDLGRDYNGFNQVYEKGATHSGRHGVLRMLTGDGLAGEYPGGSVAGLAAVAPYLLGRNPFEREKIYNDLKRGLRHTDRTAISMVDVALWDLAARAYGVPLYQLLGGWKKKLPAYASTYHGDDNGGLSTPEQFADFAEQCAGMGYRAFKIHGWGNGPMEREVANVHEMGRRLGDRLDLMIDPACEYETWADALRIGRACDEEGFFWLEDAYKDGGVSIFAHRKLREKIRTPILQTEHIFGLEQHVDFVVHGGTDFVRSGVYEDGGITGVIKVAHAAEGFGLDVELHGGGLAHRHCMAAIRNTNYYELGLVHPLIRDTKPPVYPRQYLDELDSIDAEGCVAVPEGPGLGVELDWDWIEAHRVDTIVYE
ncbi:MAG: enolase C-terminal domain-like protein [Gemmatimonadota bacterium]